MIFKRVTNDVARRFPKVKGRCRYCKAPLENKRLSWCGGWMQPNGCFTKAQREGNWVMLRQAAWKRSKGKCEKCGFDIAAMMKDLQAYRDKGGPVMVYANTMYGKRARLWPHDCWAADHIVPIAEGGASLPPLEGVRILDLVCHDEVTAELRKRLAERRRRHRWMPLFPKP